MPTTVSSSVITRLRGLAILWATLLAGFVVVRLADLDASVEYTVRQGLIVILIGSVTWAIMQLTGEIVGARARSADQALHTPNLVTNLARALVATLGGLIVLQTLGIPVTPLVTALGVGGLAVGLALQDTLANLFAGIHVLVSRQVRRGDFIRLNTGEEGYVQDVTWRYTTIRQLPNNLAIVPNARLASAITVNFSLPDPEQVTVVDVAVTLDSDPEQVQRSTEEVATTVMREVPGGCPDFRPYVRFHSMNEAGIRFAVTLRAKHYVSQYLVIHEFIKRLHDRYREEGIDIVHPPGTNGLVKAVR